MREVRHWNEERTISLAESRGGVLVTTHPDNNMVRACSPWPTPELLQKYYASSKFEGLTREDSEAATLGLGHYTDLQSLNSEDAMTWSVFGNLAYAPASKRLSVFNRILESVGVATVTDAPVCWLWRRLPHPEKRESSGGPEIDFALRSDTTLILGEAKWNSKLGTGQGVARNRSQLYLRVRYCETQARRAMPRVNNFIVLGVGRSANVFDGEDEQLETNAIIKQLSWIEILECFPEKLASQLRSYLQWKILHSGRAP